MKSKEDVKVYQDNYRIENKERLSEYKKAYWIKNKERIKKYKQGRKEKDKILNSAYHKKHYSEYKEKKSKYYKLWRSENKEKITASSREYKRQRAKTDIQFHLSKILRTRLYHALKSTKKSGSAIKDLGCTVQELKTYLESKFVQGMTWDNWSYTGWHVDHIRPLVSFDLTDREQLLQAVHYTNLQPLWAVENQAKGSKCLK